MAKVNIDFDVMSDLYYLKVFDFSNWDHIERKPSIIEILRPGYSTPHVAYFDKNKVNIFNSIMLDANCIDCASDSINILEDGIYVITVKGSPDSFYKERKYLKTDSLQKEIDKIYIDAVTNKEREYISDKLAEIEFFLNAAASHLRYDMERESRMCFDQAKRLTEKLTDCKNC
jgi:hypothetical protein